ncbi:MFS transporter [Nonomuraea sp. NPDC051191]|uniref:MFS transporter n=1 Tax=Nonomuraea sp. NPDC051191 TaxID=3364372 RepID=UPI0037A87A78
MKTHRPEPSFAGWPTVRYVGAATLVRCVDGGATVCLILLAIQRLPQGAAAGGLFVALLTVPHLLGPWLARRLDGAADGRRLLAGAFALHGAALAAGAALMGVAPLPVVGALLLVAGAGGPMVTGGLSSRLPEIAARGRMARGRAEGWDAVTYGVGGTAGPALAAGLAAMAGPLSAVLALGAAAVVAGALVLTLPADPAAHRREGHAGSDATARRGEGAMTVRQALGLMVTVGPLRRVLVATLLTAVTAGGLTVVAVEFGARLGHGATAGAALAAVYGLGNLAGSLAVTAFPLRGEPERLTVRHVVILAVALVLCAFSPVYPVAVAAFGLAGFANAPLFAASLAARSAYSPPRARAQVFVSVAGLKMGLSSVGAAAAGAALVLGPRALLAAGAALVLLAALVAVADRRLTASSARPRPERPGTVPVPAEAACEDRT